MTFHILRHAEKEVGEFYNPRLRHQDPPISEQGQRSAEKLYPYFAEKQIAAIYVSGYQRTWQTIEYTARKLGLEPIHDERLNEVDNGLVEGLGEDKLKLKYPEVWQGFRDRNHDFRFPEGETGEEACNRIAGFLEEKRQQHGNDSLIVVCHDGLTRLMMCHLMGIPVYQRWNFQVDFCGITEITYQPKHATWKLIHFNHTCP